MQVSDVIQITVFIKREIRFVVFLGKKLGRVCILYHVDVDDKHDMYLNHKNKL